MSECRTLKEIKKNIEAGMDPEEAIPWSMHCSTIQEYIDVLYYALQVLPDTSSRKESIRKKYIEVLEDVRGTAGEL